MTPQERERVQAMDEVATQLITRNRRLCKGTVARYVRKAAPAKPEGAETGPRHALGMDLVAMLGLDGTAHVADALPVSTGFHDSTTALSTADARRRKVGA